MTVTKDMGTGPLAGVRGVEIAGIGPRADAIGRYRARGVIA